MSTGLQQFEIPQQELLTKKAWGDFVHDFDDPIRANVTLGVLNQIKIKETQNLKKLYGTLFELIRTQSGGKTSITAFKMFSNFFTTTIPTNPAVEVPTKPLHESDITDLAQIPYARIMNGLKASAPALIPIASDLAIAKRKYSVSAFPEKIGGNHIHMALCLNAVTRAQNIILMWDAGSCEISEIGSKFDDPKKLIPGFKDNVQYNIFFINSKENLSDPAPKPTADTLSSSNPNVRLYFLEEADLKAPTIYPVWPHDKSDQNANVFSKYKLVTTRGKEKAVGGTLFTSTGEAIDVEDIKESSKVANAVANAVLSRLSGDSQEKQMAYFFLKRAGDWCQALTLLDKSRKYTIRNGPIQTPNGTMMSTASLEELERELNAVSMLITNDRVLLSYGATLGLNIVFTNVRNAVNWIVYFKNEEQIGRIDDKDQVLAEANQNAIGLTGPQGSIEYIKAAREYIQTNIRANIKILENVENFKTNSNVFVQAFTSIRGLVFSFVRLPTEESLTSLLTTFQTNVSMATQTSDPQKLGQMLSVLRTASVNYKSSLDVIKTLTEYRHPDYDRETEVLKVLIANVLGGAILSSSSDAYIQFQNIIDKLKSDSKKTDVPLLQALPSDAVIIPKMNSVGVSLGQSKGTRIAPSMSSLGFLYDYYNRQITATKGGKRKRLRLKGGGQQGDSIFNTILVPKLTMAKTIIQYDNATVDAAYVVDATDFIAKDENYIIMLDGTHRTVVDRFIFEDMKIGDAVEMFKVIKSQLQNDFTKLEQDAYFPILYITMRGVLDKLDEYYDRLIGFQSLEFSNLEAVRAFAELKKELNDLKNMTEYWDVNEPNTASSLYNILNAVETWYNTKTPYINPEDILQEYYRQIGICSAPIYSGGPLNCAGKDFIEGKRSELSPNEDPTLFFDEYGPQYMYSTDVTRTIGNLLTFRDDIIEFFAMPLFAGQLSLRGYSNLIYTIPTPDNNLPVSGEKTPLSRIEQNIVETHDKEFGKTDPPVATGGGLRTRRPLYSNVQASDSPRIDSDEHPRLRKRARTRRARRVRKSARKSKTRR